MHLRVCVIGSYMDSKTLNRLKEFERSGTIAILLALNRLGEGKFTDVYYEIIRTGFMTASGVVSRRLDSLCSINWVRRVNDGKAKIFTLTEEGTAIANAVKNLIKCLEKNILIVIHFSRLNSDLNSSCVLTFSLGKKVSS